MLDSRPQILVVDDEPDITTNLAAFLERSGFSTRTAADGEAALQNITEYPPDLVVLDVLMPRLDGREALRRLRRAENWTPVILLTQVGEAFERAMALEEGADDYLNKPFDPHELVARHPGGAAACPAWRAPVEHILDTNQRGAVPGPKFSACLCARSRATLRHPKSCAPTRIPDDPPR